MDDSQAKNEISFLQSNISNLESLNSSLEKAKLQIEVKYKKILKEKEEISEKIDDLIDEVESLKQTRIQQELQIYALTNSNQKLSQDLEEEQRTTKEYKNKLATLLVNSNALRNEHRSMTPTLRLRDDDIVSKKFEEEENVHPRKCKTVETDNLQISPDEDLESLLAKIETIAGENIPETIVKWCQKVLGHENYVLRYAENESVISSESKSNADNISIASEVNNQEISYKTHLKLTQQKKMIDGLFEKLKDKKQRIKVLKDHTRTLQAEIRKLDQKLNHDNNLDIEYLKSAVLKFSSKLNSLDNDSLTMLQIIFSQLGLSNEGLPAKEVKKKWGLFKSKEKK